MMRLFTGVLRPRVAVTESDFAGKIEAVGNHVQSFKVGDRVMGFGGVFGSGSHAHYLAFPESKAIAIIPDNLTYEEAAACVEGAVYAFNGVSAVNPRRGHTALVNGATGAIGSSMVQLLKHQGVSVTAVCRGEHGALVRSLGAERVIDYRTEDFTKDSRTYDLVLDAVGTSTFGRCKPILKDTGVYTSSGGFQNLLLALTTPLLGGKKVAFPPPRGMRASLGFVRDLAERGSFTPVIDRRYPLEKIAEAFEYVATGSKIGNVIITVRLTLRSGLPQRVNSRRNSLPRSADISRVMPKRRKRSTRRPTPVAYSVYIVELDRRCVRVPCAFAPLYVGQTAHSPEERFEQHKAGGRLAAAKPHRFGVRLRYDLMKGIGPFKTRTEAEAAEMAVASALEKRGHRVFWG